MRTSSRRLATAVLALSLVLFGISSAYATSSQTISFSGAAFNSNEPSIGSVTSPASTWTAVIFVTHQFFNETSVYTLDFVSSSDPSSLSATPSANSSYTQGAGWFQYVRFKLSETGAVDVRFLMNSTSSSDFSIFSCASCWLSNGTAVGTLTTNPESTASLAQEVFIYTQGDSLYAGTINSTTGALTYWVSGFGLTSIGLGGVAYSGPGFGTTVHGGLTNIGGSCGSYYGPGSNCHATSLGGNGYAQVEIDPSGFTSTQTIGSMIGIVYMIIPLFILLAVLGMVVRIFKGFSL